MNEGRIIIVSNDFDGHVDHVAHKLMKLGEEFVRINTEDLFANASILFEIDNSLDQKLLRMEKSKILLNLETIKSIWYRKPVSFSSYPDLNSEEKTFARSEIGHVMNGIYQNYRERCHWMSFPKDILDASFKLEQLVRAKRFGFKIPSSIITNIPEQAKEFFNAHPNGVISKPLADPYIGKADAIYNQSLEYSEIIPMWMTTEIKQDHIQHLDEISLVPMLFQEKIVKDYELRITVVENEVFCAKIDSQKSEVTQTDWRYVQSGIFTPYELPKLLSLQILKFVHSYNLNYSALDFIVDVNGEYIFLENNPNGQYGMIENEIDSYRVSDAVVESLIRGKTQDVVAHS